MATKRKPVKKATKPKSKAKLRTRYGYQRNGEWLIEPRFEKAEPFHGGLAAVQVNGQWGYIDHHGDFAIEPRFFRAGRFGEGSFAQVTDERGEYYIDRRGEFAFRHRRATSDGLFAARVEGTQPWDSKWGFREAASGEWVITPQFAGVSEFYGEWATAMKWIEGVGGRHGLIDRSGTWLIEPTHLLENGVEKRGGIFTEKVDGEYVTGIVHPQDGIVVPFKPRRLKPGVGAPAAPYARTSEDEALVVVKKRVEVDDSTERSAFPFRFYGVGVGSFESTYDYRIEFERSVDIQAAADAVQALLGAEVDVDGRFVLASFEPDLPPDEQDELLPGLKEVHSGHSIVEVVNLVITDYCDSPWQRWSLEQQEHPNDGPTFGHEWTW